MTSFICTPFGCRALLPVFLVNMQEICNATNFSSTSALPTAMAGNSGYFTALQQNMLVWAFFACLLQILCMFAIEVALCTASGRAIISEWLCSKSDLTRSIANLLAKVLKYQNIVLDLETMGIDLMGTANQGIAENSQLQVQLLEEGRDNERRLSGCHEQMTRRESDNSSENENLRGQVRDHAHTISVQDNTIAQMTAGFELERQSFEASKARSNGQVTAANLAATNSEVARNADALIHRTNYNALVASTDAERIATAASNRVAIENAVHGAVAPYKFTLCTLYTNSLKEPFYAEGMGVSRSAAGCVTVNAFPAWGDVYDPEVRAMKLRHFDEKQAELTAGPRPLSSVRPSIYDSAQLRKALDSPLLPRDKPIAFAYASKPNLEGRPDVPTLEIFITQAGAKGAIAEVRGYPGLLALARSMVGQWEMRRVEACRGLVGPLGAAEAYAAVYNLPRVYARGLFAATSIYSADAAGMRLVYDTLLPLIHPANNPGDVLLATSATQFLEEAGSLMFPVSGFLKDAAKLFGKVCGVEADNAVCR